MGSDTLVYENYLTQVRDGNFLFRDHFTTEPQNIGILNIFWLTIGLFGRITGAAPEVTFTISRLIFFGLLIAATYIVSGLLWKDEKTRLRATVFATTITGLGYLLNIFSYGKIETTDFLKLFSLIGSHAFATPHISAATILTTSCLLTFYKWTEEHKPNLIIAASIIGAILLEFQPYTFPLLIFIPMTWLFMTRENHSRKHFLHFILYAVMLSIPIAYHIGTVLFDSFTALRYTANITPSAPLIYDLIGFSIILSLCVIGALHKKDAGRLPMFLAVWIAISFIATHLPFRMNIRFIQGTAIVLCLLSFTGFEYVYNNYLPSLKSKLKQKIILVALVFGLWGGLAYSIPTMIQTCFLPITKPLMLFQDALNSLPPGITISDNYATLLASARTKHYAYVGHWGETIDYKNKIRVFEDIFFQKNTPAASLGKLQSLGIDYVLFDKKFDVLDTSLLSPLYENGSYAIFGVPKP
ncbi:MAG: hypothetical protein WCJ29_04145 [bacterium]